MANGWTPERKERQSELIRRWQPWKQSTGPRTEAGKARCASNSLKHGCRSADILALRNLLRELGPP